MPSPVPKHLRTEVEIKTIPSAMRDHVVDLRVFPVKSLEPSRHPAKYQAGLATVLVSIAGSASIGDPMAGSGRLVEETGGPYYLNDIDPSARTRLERLADKYKGKATCEDARKLSWSREVMIFSPPYYPRTDRKIANQHDDDKRGPVVGFRDTYGCDNLRGFIGEPDGVNAILFYRNAMRVVYHRLRDLAGKMILVTKNWTRLGVELRLDLDTILTANEAGWDVVERHGWVPNQSLWSRFNQARGGGCLIEDVLVFERRRS